MSKRNQFKVPVSISNTTSSSTDSFKTPQVRQRKISSSSSDQSSICSNSYIQSSSKADSQHQLDLKYNEYLRARLTNKLLQKKMKESKDLLNEQSIQLAMITKELTDLKCQLEIQKENSSYSKTIKWKIHENSIIAKKVLENLNKNCTNYKEMQEYFKIMSSQMPLNNVDLTGYNNELFYKSLSNINELLTNISNSFATCQINKLKGIFEKINVKNEQLTKLHNECLEQLNFTATNVIINATIQLSIESKNETEP